METLKSNLSQSMHHINSGYANFFKRQEKVFKERFRCHILNEDTHLVEFRLYIHLPSQAFPQSPVFRRNAAIYLIKKYTGLNNREIMPLFLPIKQSSISQMSRRFQQAMAKDRKIEQKTERVEKQIN